MDDRTAEVARRRLELLDAELAELRASSGRVVPVAEPAADWPQPNPSPLPAAAGRHAHRPVSLGGRVAGWVHDRLPAALQGRVQLGASQLSVVAVIVALALGVTAWWVVRAGGERVVAPRAPGAMAAPSMLVTLSGPASASTSSTASASASASTSSTATDAESARTADLVVDVTGKVRRPGIVELPAGSRVVDALKAAGGARPGVSLEPLNLARLLVDGEQVVVGLPAVPGVAASAASAPTPGGTPGGLVNINTADQPTLETLPGVGPVTAQAILQWRADNGAFSSVDELLEVSGIGEVTLSEMAPLVTL